MDSRMLRVATGLAGLFYASVGFFVSVVAILVASLWAILAPGFGGTLSRFFSPSTKRLGGPGASFDKSPKSLTASSSFPSTLETTKRNNLHPKFDDIPTSSRHQLVRHDSKSIHPASGPQTARSPRISTSGAYISMSEVSRPAFRLSNLRPPWGDKRQKIYHRVSSPHLITATSPFPSNHGGEVQHVIKKSNYVRRALSAPNCPLSSPDKGSTHNQVVVKKHSQSLRTQPYEAPYFFPTPIPSRDVSGRDRPARTRTLPRSRRLPSYTPLPTITIHPA